MRKAIARAVYSDAELNSLGITRASIHSGDVDTPSERPYIVFRWGETNPGVDVVRQRSLVVWVHDRPNDYDLIDRIIKRIRDVLTGMIAQRTDTGWISSIDWTLDSGDLSDDISRTIIRTSTYNVVGSGQ